MKKFYINGVSEVELLNGNVEDLGQNPTGIVIYDKNGEIVGFETYDNAIFYGVEIVKAVRCTGDNRFLSINELTDEILFNYDDEYKFNSFTQIKEI
ncbi:hypothetical protein [Campylobacter sp. RM16191]|uniref:hypothetical protein n=1 Tax=Campylobacter sp. RM16191 TaxID=1705728 RepID=UPI0014735A93|nr:hypothetical protein [Campylobacter sp. RM16191]